MRPFLILEKNKNQVLFVFIHHLDSLAEHLSCKYCPRNSWRHRNAHWIHKECTMAYLSGATHFHEHGGCDNSNMTQPLASYPVSTSHLK